MKRNLLNIFVGVVLVAIAILMLVTFQVRQSEIAVVTTFGKLAAEPYGPGWHAKFPWPIQKVYKIDQRIQNFEDKFTEDLTSDGINLVTTVYVGWSITNATEFFPRFPGGSTEAAQKMLEGVLRSSQTGVVGRHVLSDFVNPDPAQIKFDAIEAEIQQLVQSQLTTNNCGIEINFLGLKKIELPDSVTQTVFTRMTAERNVLSSRWENEGEAEAKKIRSAADRQSAEMLADAQANATRIRGEGEADAAKILTTFQQNPQLANFLLRIEGLKELLKERSTLILDERTPPFDLFRGSWTNAPGY
jgi:membrane protease subunit HflC